MHTELGESLLKIIKIIPNGILIFFTSYALLEVCYKSWSSSKSNILKLMEENKNVIKETRNDKYFINKMNQFEKYASNEKGAIFLAVLKRKSFRRN